MMGLPFSAYHGTLYAAVKVELFRRRHLSDGREFWRQECIGWALRYGTPYALALAWIDGTLFSIPSPHFGRTYQRMGNGEASPQSSAIPSRDVSA